MVIIYFFIGLSFAGLGLAAYLRLRQGEDFALMNHLPGLAVFSFVCAVSNWIDMFLVGGVSPEYVQVLKILRMVFQPLSGLLLLKFGWGILKNFSPLPAWAVLIPGVLIVPIALIIAYATTTFITPSPLDIPIDIWSRYLLYLPGAILAGIGFLHQGHVQRKLGFQDVSRLMLGAGLGFLFEAFVVGLIVPAAPYGPASYYNYDRVIYNAFSGENGITLEPFGLTAWLDYQRVLDTTGLPIQFWRMLSAFAVTFFVAKGLEVFDAIRKRQMAALQNERDQAQKAAFESQVVARQSAEHWTDALINISRRIAELDDLDRILLYIVENARRLLHSDFIGLAIRDKDTSSLELKYVSYDDLTEIVNLPARVENPLILAAYETSQHFRSGDYEAPGQLSKVCFFSDKPAGALAVVPICLDTTPIGAMWIARCQPAPYTETDLIWLECLADQVMIAINHGLMTSQLQSLSIIEERGRIARDMHDGLAQVLGYMNLQVQTLTALLQQGKHEAVLVELSQMRQAIQVTHADVRQNILSLRTTLASEKGLIASVEEYIVEYGLQTGIDVQFVHEIGEEIGLSSLAEVQLVCILQEALTNIRKHAQASRVSVDLHKDETGEPDLIRLRIKDNGVGFIMTESKRSFGLQTMRERAGSVDGDILIRSTPEEGTLVDCWIPCLSHDQVKHTSPVFQ